MGLTPKNTRLAFASLFLILITGQSCTKASQIASPDISFDEFRAVIVPGSPDSKTSVSSDYSTVSWMLNDSIGLLVEGLDDIIPAAAKSLEDDGQNRSLSNFPGAVNIIITSRNPMWMLPANRQ